MARRRVRWRLRAPGGESSRAHQPGGRDPLLRARGSELPLDTETRVAEGGPGPQGCCYGTYGSSPTEFTLGFPMILRH